MKLRKRIISVFLALLFTLSFPVSSFAEESTAQQEEQAAETAIAVPEDDSSDREKTEEPGAAETLPTEENEQKADAERDPDVHEVDADKPRTAPQKGILLDGKLIRDPVFTVLKNGETLYLSIGEKDLRIFVDFFRKEMNMNSAAIAGILANLQFESQFDPNKIGDYGYAYGLCQWRGPRLDAMMEFCEEKGLNPITVEGQLCFLKEEFENSHRYAGNLVCDTPDTLQGALRAVQNFCFYYEVPSDPDQVLPDRERIAKELIYPLLVEWENSK